jgi:MscS family membrane protein
MDKNLKEAIQEYALLSLEYQIFGIPAYKWILALTVFLFFLFIKKILARNIIKFLIILTRKTKNNLDDKIVKVLITPLNFSFIVVGIWLAITILGLKGAVITHIIRTFIIIIVFWIFYRSVDLFQDEIYKFSAKFGRELSREIGNFFIKTLRVVIIIFGILSVLQEWGINVSAFIASLGIGGLAFALAAKDTVANLFGGLTILADKAMKLGDWVKVGIVEGIVEDIGLRTTKIRTFEKSLITVPNSYIANNPIENFSRRKNRRIKMYVGIVYDTPFEAVERIVNEIRAMLINHPRIDKTQTLLVYLDELGDSSLNIFVYTFTDTADWKEYLEIKQDVIFQILKIVEKNGSALAFPSQSLYIEKLPDKLPKGFKVEYC